MTAKDDNKTWTGTLHIHFSQYIILYKSIFKRVRICIDVLRIKELFVFSCTAGLKRFDKFPKCITPFSAMTD